MGMYIYISDFDRIAKRKVSDPFVNEEFQEALKCDPTLMIEEYISVIKGFFSKRTFETRYNIYHEMSAFDGSAYQARYQASASGDAKTVIAYLHGIINGISHYKNTQ